MTIIKIEPYENGAHDNNTIYGADSATFPVPEGYAIVPDDMPIPETCPFVDITVTKSKPPRVKTMTAGTVPQPEPEPYIPTTEDRLTALEAATLTLMMGGSELV